MVAVQHFEIWTREVVVEAVDTSGGQVDTKNKGLELRRKAVRSGRLVDVWGAEPERTQELGTEYKVESRSSLLVVV